VQRRQRRERNIVFRTLQALCSARIPPEGDPMIEKQHEGVTADETVENARKAYTTPTLVDFGSFTEITQGTFAGVGPDSGVYS
jgi:hypothetical protein